MRTKDGAEVDVAISHAGNSSGTLTDLVECKSSDAKPHHALRRFASEWPNARATQLVRDLRQPQDLAGIAVHCAAPWLAQLAAQQRASRPLWRRPFSYDPNSPTLPYTGQQPKV